VLALGGGLVFAAMFAYISGSSFVTQEIYGVSPQVFGLIFGVNALGIVLASQVNSALLGRVAPGTMLAVALAVHLAGGLGVLAAVASGSHRLVWLLPPLFLAVAMVGVVLPNTTALALAGHPEAAGPPPPCWAWASSCSAPRPRRWSGSAAGVPPCRWGSSSRALAWPRTWSSTRSPGYRRVRGS